MLIHDVHMGTARNECLSSQLIRDKSKMSPPVLKVRGRNGKEDAFKITGRCPSLLRFRTTMQRVQPTVFIVNFVSRGLISRVDSRRRMSSSIFLGTLASSKNLLRTTSRLRSDIQNQVELFVPLWGSALVLEEWSFSRAAQGPTLEGLRGPGAESPLLLFLHCSQNSLSEKPMKAQATT